MSKSKWVCLCNKVSLETIQASIKRGCKDLRKIALSTTAGAGQCGGSCKPDIEKILLEELKSKKENPR